MNIRATMDLKVKQINDVKVKPIKTVQVGGKFKGSKLFSEPYGNIAIYGRKKSGKSSCIFKIIQECAGRNTTVILFVSTIKVDPSYKAIKAWLKERGISCISFSSTEGDSRENHLADLISHMQKNEDDSDADDDEPHINADDEKSKPSRAPKAPEYLIILDDLSEAELRSKPVYTLLKHNRHFKSKVIISSQDVKDITPKSLKQIQTFILFPNLDEDRLSFVYKKASFPIDEPTFMKMYKQATKDPYNFFYASTDGDFRHNFDKQFD
jgi:hypothetical protein